MQCLEIIIGQTFLDIYLIISSLDRFEIKINRLDIDL